MLRKIHIILLLFTFISCQSSETIDTVESVESRETSKTTTSLTTTTTKAQDLTTTSATTKAGSSTTTTSTTLAPSTTSITVNPEDITLPSITVTNCPVNEVNVETYELNYEITAGDYDVDYLRISFWKNDDYYSRVYFDKTHNSEHYHEVIYKTINGFYLHYQNGGTPNYNMDIYFLPEKETDVKFFIKSLTQNKLKTI